VRSGASRLIRFCQSTGLLRLRFPKPGDPPCALSRVDAPAHSQPGRCQSGPCRAPSCSPDCFPGSQAHRAAASGLFTTASRAGQYVRRAGGARPDEAHPQQAGEHSSPAAARECHGCGSLAAGRRQAAASRNAPVRKQPKRRGTVAQLRFLCSGVSSRAEGSRPENAAPALGVRGRKARPEPWCRRTHRFTMRATERFPHRRGDGYD
jgi:hypothetical protein